jgi:homoserine O-acetyltransferase
MKRHIFYLPVFAFIPTLMAQGNSSTPTWPAPTHGTFDISNFAFDSGETLETLSIHYQTIGELQVYENGTSNAVLLLHGTFATLKDFIGIMDQSTNSSTGSTGSGDQFLSADLAGALFNPGQTLSADQYFLILPDSIGHGNSSKPSNTGLHAHFPSYQYSDMVRAEHLLLTSHLGINHTRLTLGVSMGGMHTWLWGEQYPDFSDALMPIACQPAPITGQNRLWRKFLMELIRTDPAWEGGEYTTQPIAGLGGALALSQAMFYAPLSFQKQYPTRDAVDAYVDALLPQIPEFDANDQLYAWNASHTYDPVAELGLIQAPLTAVNTADDMMNPPVLGTLEDAVENKMQRGIGKAVILPVSDGTVGHASYGKADFWKEELRMLLARTETR